MTEEKSRPVRNMWWEGNDLHIVYADNGEHVKFTNVQTIAQEYQSPDPTIMQVTNLTITKGKP